jgi:hypothetical protein
MMTDDELAGIVVGMFSKMRDYLPYIVALKDRFNDGNRDSLNRLRAPIRGCRTWKEFCKSVLGVTPQAIRDAIRSKQLRATTVDLATYELENPSIREMAKKFLTQMTPEDVIGALISQDVPQRIAEALVQSVTGQPVLAPSEVSPLDVAFKSISPLLGEAADCPLNALPTALDWVKQNQPLTAYQIETLSAVVTALGQISKLTSHYHDKLEEVLGLVQPR